MLHGGYQWCGHIWWVPGFEGEVYETGFLHKSSGIGYISYYTLAPARGKGYLKELVARGLNIITTPACAIQSALEHLGAPHTVTGELLVSPEYRLIEDYYGEQRARRSQVFLMNHIDEGLAVMATVQASSAAMRAFCLHPLLQDDEALARNYRRVSAAMQKVPDGAYVLGLALEYRSVANAYLAHCTTPPDGIRLSPLKEVNQMLIGDKVQNRKDFELYHAATHKNRERLAQYFQEWCQVLGVAHCYDSLKKSLPIN